MGYATNKSSESAPLSRCSLGSCGPGSTMPLCIGRSFVSNGSIFATKYLKSFSAFQFLTRFETPRYAEGRERDFSFVISKRA